ncbi:DUF6502 family protein [Granulosicoccus antarcticus]|uniref:Uncharacterized protein n=1 Tax=Granulosicoccus antarcticus IMCC3135 TaxID=1192854 RepID=A0A2Z2NQK9_9GAMM|nr:DUF6502 family protein [Granulosicoccus antarcticus]ASJ71958.1 hypothetical protein IMCC3135_09305 [Granulosicoccus antarcticus IMCC3135]
MSETLKLSLAKSVVSILRPMIRLLIRFEVTHLELSELVRQTYVEVADRDFAIEGEEMTISRVAVLTGLSRKEVVRLRNLLDESTTSLKQKPNRAQRVVQGWLADKEFLDRKRNPRVLPIKGHKSSFVTLVKRYSGDITYGAVLEELNRSGVTSQPDEYSVALVNPAYIPHADDLDQVRILSMCVADLFWTGVSNVDADPGDKMFQRQVTYNLLDECSAHDFKVYSTEKAAELIADLNKFLAKKREQAGKKTYGKSKRVGMGIYYLEETQMSMNDSNKDKEER